MKKFLSVSLATLLVVSTLPAVSSAATKASPGEVTNVTPANFTTGVNRNAVLEAVITDPNGSALKTVEFREGITYDFGSDNGITAFQGSYNEDPLTAGADGGTAFTEAYEAAAAFPDQKFAATDSEGAFPFQRFEVDVTQHVAAGNEIEVHWQGKTLANGKLILSAWDYTAAKWVTLDEKTAGEGGNITFSQVVTDSKFFQNGKIQAMVHDAAPAPAAVADNEVFSMAWFTDTQYYAAEKPEVWESMTDWMIAEYNNGRFGYVINSGDLVNTSTNMEEWAVADENLRRMDAANVPYGVMAGNRDVVNQETSEIEYTNFWTYAGKQYYEGKPWYGEQMDNNRNHYDLISFGEHDFIILYLGYGKVQEDETVQWANQMLEKHADKNAIMVVHNYLSPGGYRSKDGDYIFANVVKKSENVKMVLGGHYFGADYEIRTITDADGTTRQVLEVLSNYQGKEGAEGYMRILTFDPATDTVGFQTYSPYYDDYNYFEDGRDEFSAGYKLAPTDPVAAPAHRQVSTDYVAVNVFTDSVIGTESDLQSGDTASANWESLEAFTEYFWYIQMKDASDAVRNSQIYRFTTGEAAEPIDPGTPTDPEDPGTPTDPEDPGTPTDPEDPGTPTDPEDPGTPTDPEDPGTPTDPEDPGTPTDPEDPGTPTDPENPGTPTDPVDFVFTDVSDKYKDAVTYLLIRDITQGISATQFGTDHSIKRVDAAVMLAKALNLDISNAPDSGFTDVPARAVGSVNALKAAGIVNGKTATTFDSNAYITRGEMALILAEAYQLNTSSQNMPFTDVSERYAESVAALVEFGITQGKTPTQFGTTQAIKRGDYAIFLYRLYNLQ